MNGSCIDPEYLARALVMRTSGSQRVCKVEMFAFTIPVQVLGVCTGGEMHMYKASHTLRIPTTKSYVWPHSVGNTHEKLCKAAAQTAVVLRNHPDTKKCKDASFWHVVRYKSACS